VRPGAAASPWRALTPPFEPVPSHVDAVGLCPLSLYHRTERATVSFSPALGGRRS